MPHADRPLMQNQPRNTFQQVFEWLRNQPSSEVNLVLPSNVNFTAIASRTNDGRNFIECTGGNRIYECCWGNHNNHMGQEGQRIGHYSAELDANCR